MTKIKLCGLKRPEDIEAAKLLCPDYIGFVFARKSKRYVSPKEAADLKKLLNKDKNGQILAVGVFVDEDTEKVADLLKKDVIDLAQLHGNEDEEYIRRLKALTGKPVIKAFRIKAKEDLFPAESSSADHILLDAGAGDGRSFDWEILKGFKRPYFLAGGLDPSNIGIALKELNPYGVDVSSGIETDGCKDPQKMSEFVTNVRCRQR